MLKFILLFFIAGNALAASLSVSLDSFDNQPNNCPMFDDEHKLTVKVHDANGDVDTGSRAMINLSISCSTAGATATVRHTASMSASQGVAEFLFTPQNNRMVQKDSCTITASATGISSGTLAFTVGFLRRGTKPPARVRSAITVGESFNIGGLFVFDDSVPFYDLLLRECTASSDPWLFWLNEDNSELHRVYPTPNDINLSVTIKDLDTSNDNLCLGMYDGGLKNLFTIGSNYDSCQLKLVKESVTGGNSFTAQGAPTLASGVAVTLSNGNVMLNTGAKPTDTAGLSDTIVVYVSTNRGFSWTKSTDITSWTTTATDSGIDTSNTDNSRNLAIIKITKTTSTWWRLVRGQ